MIDHPAYPDPFLTKTALSNGFYVVAAAAAQVVAPNGQFLPVKQDRPDLSGVITREPTRGNCP